MKLRQVNYAEDSAEIKDVTVTLSLAEAIALVNLAGQFTGYANRKLGLINENDSLYDTLAEVFNRHYTENSYPKLGITLSTLNDGTED